MLSTLAYFTPLVTWLWWMYYYRTEFPKVMKFKLGTKKGVIVSIGFWIYAIASVVSVILGVISLFV